MCELDRWACLHLSNIVMNSKQLEVKHFYLLMSQSLFGPSYTSMCSLSLEAKDQLSNSTSSQTFQAVWSAGKV